MKKILLIGAGRSSSELIHYLLEKAGEKNWEIVIGDVSEANAREKTGAHPKARAIQFDVNDADQRSREVAGADLIISLLPPHLHQLLAEACVSAKKPFLTASYLTPEIQSLNEAAKKAGVLVLNECGLDPGIDHMSAVEMIDRLKSDGCTITSFKSYTGGLVAPESNNNPWGYKFSWNPRNVILAGQGTARYILNGNYKYIPYSRLYTEIESVSIDGLGKFDGYANRDSLAYRQHYGIAEIPTLFRGTLRQAGFCRGWDVFVKLGLTDDSYKVEKCESLSYGELIKAFLPVSALKTNLLDSVAAFCGLPPEGEAMTKVAWTGILGDEKIGITNASPAMILQHLLEPKWKLQEEDKDMIVMQHQFEYVKDGKPEKITSSLVVIGDNQQHTAMAKTVGLPLGIAATLVLEDKLKLTGVHIPNMKAIYEPILMELKTMGISFTEK